MLIKDSYQKLKADVLAMEADVTKAVDNNNKAASTRVRKGLSNMAKQAKSLRHELLEVGK